MVSMLVLLATAGVCDREDGSQEQKGSGIDESNRGPPGAPDEVRIDLFDGVCRALETVAG